MSYAFPTESGVGEQALHKVDCADSGVAVEDVTARLDCDELARRLLNRLWKFLGDEFTPETRQA
ncbi:hypothetical protein DSM21852_23720 [Methylocystis bryophila]|uniref:Uncharacterized protein n=1 Tax=Methylocystis bryophila TaxID=655015 RepID=A0A1W6MZ44_9HYPH|nr:hypothetical protein B1812_19205 [Methylocystis bryophila]BDV39119.1 hypothetical protein DSM21852_23720 [Methylocystis bryophila]